MYLICRGRTISFLSPRMTSCIAGRCLIFEGVMHNGQLLYHHHCSISKGLTAIVATARRQYTVGPSQRPGHSTHLTKALGRVGLSQLPLQVLMSPAYVSQPAASSVLFHIERLKSHSSHSPQTIYCRAFPETRPFHLVVESWPYHFISLSEDDKLHRREMLDLRGCYAQWSIIVPSPLFHIERLKSHSSHSPQTIYCRAFPETRPFHLALGRVGLSQLPLQVLMSPAYVSQPAASSVLSLLTVP
jgi:hypothetical protein